MIGTMFICTCLVGCNATRFKDKFSFRSDRNIESAISLFKQATADHGDENINVSVMSETKNSIRIRFTQTELGLLKSDWDFTFFFSKPSKTLIFIETEPSLLENASSRLQHGVYFVIKKILKRFTYDLRR